MSGFYDRTVGVGINYKAEICDDILRDIESLDLIEINTEGLFILGDDPALNEVCQRVPAVLHGLGLSLGDSDPISDTYRKNIKMVLDWVDHLWFSDHGALTVEHGIEVGGLMPVSFSEENSARMASKILEIKALAKKPFLLENISYYWSMPGDDMTEAHFLRSIVEKADCGLLLDVANLYTNAINHGYDALTFLDDIPMERVVEIHLAGSDRRFGMLVDTHSTAISEEVWALFDEACRRCHPRAVIIERDINLPAHQVTLAEVERARSVLVGHDYYRRPSVMSSA